MPANPLDKIAQSLDDGAPPPPGILGLVSTESADAMFWSDPNDDEITSSEIAARDAWDIAESSIDDAEFAMGRLREEMTAAAHVDDQAEQWVRRVATWRAARRAPHEFWIEYFGDRLRRWMANERERTNGKTKSVALLSGKLTTRSNKAGVKITEPKLVLAWAQAQGIAEVIKPTFEVQISLLSPTVHVIEWGAFDVSPDPALIPDARIVFPPPCPDSEDGSHAHGKCRCETTEPFVVSTEDDSLLDPDTWRIHYGPFVVHTASNLIVPGVEVTDETISVTVVPDL